MTEKSSKEPTLKQKLAIDANGVVCVLAGAGSGKTWVLSQRYLRLLKEKIKPQEILALTFTDKAAWEMKKRVIDECLKDESLKGLVDPIEIELAPISTFHAFCASVLRQNSFELGIDPDFSIIQEIESKAIAFSVLDALINEWRKNSDKRVKLEIAFNRLFSEMSDEPTREFRRGLISIWDKLRNTGELELILAECFKNRSYFNKFFGIDELESSEPSALISGELEEDKRAELISILKKAKELSRLSDLNRPAFERDAWEQSEILSGIERFVASLRFQGKKTEKEALYKAAALAFRTRGWLLSDALGLLAEFLSEFDERLSKAKCELGVADFSDLECWVHEGLKNKADDRFKKRLAGRYRYILVDELQDTSPIQMKILSELVALSDKKPEFFGVGDFGQSIYRFRHAEPELFKTFASLVKKSGTRVDLDTNFRSWQEILDWVKLVVSEYFESIEELKKAEKKGWDVEEIESYKPFFQTEIKADRGDCGGAYVPLEVMLVKNLKAQRGEVGEEDGEESVDELSSDEIEAEIVAKRIKELTAKGKFKCGEIAILFRKRKPMGTFKNVFERHGIPVVELAGSGFFKAAEIRDVYHLTRLLDNPYDSFDLACVLASPLLFGPDETCGLSEDAMLLLFASANYKNKEPFDLIIESDLPDEISDIDKHKLEQFAQLWRDIEKKLGAFPPDRIVMWLLKKSGYWQRAEEDNPRRTYNLRKLFSILENLKAFSGKTFHSVWRALCAFIEGNVDEEMASVPVDVSDAVRFMTVHAAKGLEFPCVIVAGSSAGVRRNSVEKLDIFPSVDLPRLSKDDFLGVKNIDWDVTPELKLSGLFRRSTEFKKLPEVENYFKTFISTKSLKETLEGLRLLYVAMTRAKGKLIISGTMPNRLSSDSFLGMIFPALERQFESEDKNLKDWIASGEGEREIIDDSGKKLGILKLYSPEDIEKPVGETVSLQYGVDLQTSASDEEEEILPISIPKVISLTQLNRFVECPKRFCWETLAGKLAEEKEGGGSGIEYGLLFHRVAAIWAESRFEKKWLARAIDEALKELEIEDGKIKARLEVELRSLIDFEVISLVCDEKVEIFSERDLTLSVDGYILHGRPDLVVHSRDKKRVWVVDYKTDALDSMEEGAAKYKIQALGYGLALSKIFEGESVDVLLYLTALGQLYKGYELKKAEKTIREALKKFVEAHRSFRFESSPKDNRCLFCAHPDKSECMGDKR